jgi:hypothetical protein
MKKLLLLTFVFSISLLLNAQDRIFNYKALITDNGNPLANQDVTIRFTILNGATTNVYQEENLATTDENGIVSVGLGAGMNTSGDFSAINWGDGSYYLKVEIDTGNGFLDFGTNEFLSVPYAKHAYKADSVNHVDYNKISNAPVTFYKTGTTNDIPTNINDEIYHSGTIIIGTSENNASMVQHKLNVYNKNEMDGGSTKISVSSATIYDRKCYGSYNSLWSDIGDTVYGSFVDIYAMSSGGKKVGYGTLIKGFGNGHEYGILNKILSYSSGNQYGVYNLITNKNTGRQYGIFSEINGEGSGNHYGSYKLLSGDGTGEQYGSYNFISNTKDADHYGVYNTMSGNGTGKHYGVYNKQWGSGSGEHYGVYNEFSEDASSKQYGVYTDIHNSGDGEHYGSYSELSGSGSGRHVGSYNILSGDGTGIQYGVHNKILTNNDKYQYGIYNHILNDGNGEHFGTLNQLAGKGNGIQQGTYNYVSNSGSGKHYGVYNIMKGNGTGLQTGVLNTIEGSNNNYLYGTDNEITNTGFGDHVGTCNRVTGSGLAYGTYNYITGNSDTKKYGSYNFIPDMAGGQHFAVFGYATKHGSYAGYFIGDVHVSKKLKTIVSGDADMKAYVYGFVLYDGNVVTDRSSDGFKVEYISTGLYKITLTKLDITDDRYIVSASTEYSASVVITNVDYADFGGATEANVFYIREFNLSGTSVDNSFHFVVYRK